MPVISRFYGLVIRMYFQQAEHNPPHIHVVFGSDIGVINIKEHSLIEGYLPAKALALTLEWTRLHETELLAIWETQEFINIAPLD